MIKFLSPVAAGGLLVFAASAALADGPSKGSSKDAPAYTAPPSWSGLYVAGGFGYGAWTADTTTVSPVTGACILCVTQTQGGKGGFGTLGVGYDRQLHERFVAGVFVDGSIGSINGTIQDQGPFFVGTIKENRMYSVGARAGLLVNPSVLAYATVGHTRAHFTGANMVTAFLGTTPTGFSTPAFSRGGSFVGGGMEAVVRPGWFWRVEYRFTDYGTAVLTDTNAFTGARQAKITFHPLEQSVRTELVYKFDWSSR
jgi:outer membrane immunogenic protein